MTSQFHIVDVFAERPYSGNPLAVVISANPLAEQTMQQIALETNYSETTFVASQAEGDGGYRVRVYTPAREIAFAGHPILGTAWVLRHHIDPGAKDSVQLNLAIGKVSVTFEPAGSENEICWFNAPAMELGERCDAAEIAGALGLTVGELADDLPIQQVSAGTAAMIVPVRSREALRRAMLNLDAYAPLAARGLPPLTYLFCREPKDSQNDLRARFFFEARGVREDPATGNGAAFLGAYLLEHNPPPGGSLSLRIEQGDEMHRPSLVRVRGHRREVGYQISVGGRVIPVARGELM